MSSLLASVDDIHGSKHVLDSQPGSQNSHVDGVGNHRTIDKGVVANVGQNSLNSAENLPLAPLSHVVSGGDAVEASRTSRATGHESTANSSNGSSIIPQIQPQPEVVDANSSSNGPEASGKPTNSTVPAGSNTTEASEVNNNISTLNSTSSSWSNSPIMNPNDSSLTAENTTANSKVSLSTSKLTAALASNSPTLSNDKLSKKMSYKKKVSFSDLQSPSALSEMSISSNSASPFSTDDEEDKVPQRKTIFKRFSTELGHSKSLDSNDSHQSLPEFNKRPLTDTPVVSSLTSPVTREQSDEEDDSHNKNMGDDVTLNSIQEEDPTSALTKTKNISHLNLTDLHAKHILEDLRSESVSPMTTVPSKVKINVENVDTLRNLPNKAGLHEKTPSLEKLKSLLLEKAVQDPKPSRSYTLNIPGQTSSKTSPDGRIAKVDVGSKLVIVMVGLPARGKSYITNKLTRYLNWLQHDCRVFNVGNTRRKDKMNAGPESKPLPDTNSPANETPSPESAKPSSPTSVKRPDLLRQTKSSPTSHDADFFSPDNKASIQIREKWAMDTLEQLLDYVIDGPGSVGIFDATNSTKHRRLRVLKRIHQRSNGELKVLFLESICSDPAIIESNIRLKLSGPDYRDMDPELALKDFEGRLHNYEKAYETIDETEEEISGFQYVKMINVGKKVVSYNCQGFLASQTVYFLLNFNLCERQIWITRHGESVDNLSGRIGGDSGLTKRGDKFARALARFMDFQRREFRKQQLENFSSRLELKYSTIFDDKDMASIERAVPTEPNFCVWTSMLIRAIETGQYFDDKLYSVKEMRMLNELGGGKFDGLTYDEIQQKYPREFDSRIKNKLSYRYPGVGGESYLDVFTRLRPLITEIERTTDHLLIISHRVVLRILLAYFLNLDKSSIGELDVPLHTLYCLESKPYGTDYRMYEYDKAIDWFVKVSPEHQKNIKEVGVAFKERKYSVVPTAPPTSALKHRKSVISDDFSIRRSLLDDTKNEHSNPAFTKIQTLNSLRKPIQ